MSQRWEYRVWEQKELYGEEEQDILDSQGIQRWELVSTRTNAQGFVVYYFKRPADDFKNKEER